jgi:uroporphyrinogen-III synthase
LVAPAIAIDAPESWTITDAALRRIGTYDWIVFTSANAVRAVVERADAIGVARDELRATRLAVVGPATADVVGAALRPPDVVSDVHTAEGLGRELVDVQNARVLLPRGDLADETLPAVLRARGAFVDEMVVYRTVAGVGLATIARLIRDNAIDALLFASASAVGFVASVIADDAGDPSGRLPAWPLAACLGPVTADAARAAGFTHVAIAEGTTQAELIDRVVEWFRRPERSDAREE